MSNPKKTNQMEYLESKETINFNEAKYLRAKERIAEEKKFYSKLISYLVLIGFLAALNYYTNKWSNMWFLWVVFGLGIALISRAIKVFGTNLFLGKGWEERKIKEFMNEDKEQNRWN